MRKPTCSIRGGWVLLRKCLSRQVRCSGGMCDSALLISATPTVLWRRIRQLAGGNVGALVAMLRMVETCTSETEAFQKLLTNQLADTLWYRPRMFPCGDVCVLCCSEPSWPVSDLGRLQQDTLLCQAVKHLLFKWQGMRASDDEIGKPEQTALLKSGYATLSSDGTMLALAAPFVHFVLYKQLCVPQPSGAADPGSPFNLVHRIVAGMDVDILRSSLSRSDEDAELFEVAWQMEFYRSLYQVVPSEIPAAESPAACCAI